MHHQGILKVEVSLYHWPPFDWFGLVCFANKNKNCQYSLTADSKPVTQEVNGTVILPPLVFPGLTYHGHHLGKFVIFIVDEVESGGEVWKMFVLLFWKMVNKNKNCQWSYRWFQTSQTGGQWYSDTSPSSIPWPHLSRSPPRQICYLHRGRGRIWRWSLKNVCFFTLLKNEKKIPKKFFFSSRPTKLN